MITGLHGTLESVDEGAAYLSVNSVTYEVLVSPMTGERLIRSGSVGGHVSLKTYHYIEGTVALGAMIPRLIGFLDDDEMQFFVRLTSVQGLGMKKALRALARPVSDIALAIEQGDEKVLVALPEIGKKTAGKIIMELKGSVAAFITESDRIAAVTQEAPSPTEEYQREAIEVLLQLQYTEQEARTLVMQTSEANPSIDSADALIQEVFKRSQK